MTQSMSPAWQPDASQLRVIETPLGGYHLVLAPPGCGKTQILTERIRRAHDQGIAYGDMLCLTFTNRAARGMRERIAQYIEGADLGQLYVGNIHRFCSRFLFEHHLVEAETSVIDDDDALSILARYQNEEESAIKQRHNRRREYAEIIQFAHFM
ncbi:MAG: UvrD-helicase domain-containing protein, partial [Prevotella sp.]|nr:UvrD-helicase domain-containing protein [Prevotella sp.]